MPYFSHFFIHTLFCWLSSAAHATLRRGFTMPAIRPSRFTVIVLLIVAGAACGEGPSEPTPIGTPPALNLTGTWDGTIGQPQSNVFFSARWTATQTNSTVTGPVNVLRVSDNVAYSGTLNGTLTGTRLQLTYTVPRGNVPGAPDCSISGTSSIEATATLLAGLMNQTAPGCEPISLLPSSVEQISLVKQ